MRFIGTPRLVPASAVARCASASRPGPRDATDPAPYRRVNADDPLSGDGGPRAD
jgi:hypothetical protein